MTEPTPREWYHGLTAEGRAEYAEAAQTGQLTTDQYERMTASGILVAAAEFPAVPGSLTYVMPGPYADYVLAQTAKRAEWRALVANLDGAERTTLIEARFAGSVPVDLWEALGAAGVSGGSMWEFGGSPSGPSAHLSREFRLFLRDEYGEVGSPA